MANYLDNIDVIDANNNPTNVLLQDRGTLSLVNTLTIRVNEFIASHKMLIVASVEHDDLGATFAAYEDDYDGFIIPDGEYNMSTSYTPSKPITIIGLNKPTINCLSSDVQIIVGYKSYIDNIKFSYPAGGHITTTQHQTIAIEADGCIVSNIDIINGNGGISVYNAKDVLIDNCSVTYSRSEIIAGIWIGGSSQETKIQNCTSSYNVLDGIHIASDGVTIEDCICDYNGTEPITLSGAIGACGIYGIDTNPGSYITIKNCKMEHNGECGIDCKFNFAFIQDCKALENGLSGIAIRTLYDSIVSNNTCTNNGNNPTTLNPDAWGHSGIDITGGNGLIITGNVCADTRSTRKQQHGINVLNGTGIALLVCNNLCTYNLISQISNITDGVNDCIVANNITLS